MKNYFVIHALGNTADDYWYKFVQKTVEKRGYKCFVPTLPPMENMSYSSWANAFDKYKKYINKDSVFIAHSTGSIFSVKYLMSNNLKIQKFIGVVSFNKNNINSPHPDWELINKTFFVDNLADFKNYATERICFYSPTDIYDFGILDEFATTIDAKKIIIKKAGHFTATTGYGEKFPEIVEYLQEL